MKSVNVRPAQDDDARDIFAWRNDEVTRKMSHSMNEIDWASHLNWYLSSLGNPNRCLLICYLPKTMKHLLSIKGTLQRTHSYDFWMNLAFRPIRNCRLL